MAKRAQINTPPKQMGEISLLRRLLMTYAAPYKGRLILGFVGMILLSMASVAPAKLMENVVDHIFVQKNASLLWPITLAIVGAFFLKGVTAYGSQLAMDSVGQRMVAGLQKDFFNHVIHFDMAYFHQHPAGDLVSRLTSDITKLQTAVTGTLSSLVKDSLTFLFFVGLMVYQDAFLASCAFVVFPLAIFPIRRISRRLRKTSSQVQENTGWLVVLATQAFQGIPLIKAYGLEVQEKKCLGEAIDRVAKRQYKTTRLKSLNHPLMEFLGGIAIAVIILYGGREVIQGTQTPGAFFSFIAALLLVYEPLKRLTNLHANLQEQLAAAHRVFALMDHPPKNRIVPGTEHRVLKGNIVLKDVTFSYDGESPVLKDLSLVFPEGKKTALVGMSGAGKSTLFHLLLRFYAPQKGSILWGGHDISKLSHGCLRSSIALVSQHSLLFHGTVAENIGLGRLDASREEIMAAAKQAAAHDFIMAMPMGYDTPVGELGGRLSGGQRQRIAIARAMLRNAPLLLLDEPTSALDADAEHAIEEASEKLAKERTTIVIAHRLSTIKNAHVIHVLDRGQLHASGDYDTLRAQSPLFKEWLNKQSTV